MRIQVLFDQGGAKVSEDGLILCHPTFYGVADGMSAPYTPAEGPRMFEGLSGGQVAIHTLSKVFYAIPPAIYFSENIVEANAALGRAMTAYGLSLEDAGSLPGALFAIAEIREREITILQVGDCLAVWQEKDGTVGATPNLTFPVQKEANALFSRIWEKHQDRQKSWEEYAPLLAQLRRQYVNQPGGIGLVNGQPGLSHFGQKTVLKKETLKLLILFTDGFVPFEQTENMQDLASSVIKDYLYYGGLRRVLSVTRSSSLPPLWAEGQPEATAVAIEF